MEKRNQLINNSSLHNCHHGGRYSVKNHHLVEIDFSSNINPLGISTKVLKMLRNNLQLAYSYPDPNCRELKKSIIKYLDPVIDIDINKNIIIGNGATELIHYFSLAFIKKNVIIPSPTFCEYELAAKRNGGRVLFSPVLENLQLDYEFIIKNANKVDNNIDCLFLCNPNNPTGKNAKNSICGILDRINSKVIILLDESYIEFTQAKARKDFNYFMNLTKDYKNLVILRSLTKTFGLAGLRVGYAIADRALIYPLSNRLISWNVNGLAQLAAIEALKDKDHLIATKKNNIVEKKRVFKLLEKNNKIRGISTDANFYLIEILNGRNSTDITRTILNKNKILVRDCKTFTGMNDKFIRVAIKTPQENNKLLTALETSV